MQGPFQLKTCFFKNMTGGCIICKGFGKNSDNVRMLKNIYASLFYRACAKSAPPIWLPDIIAHFGGFGMDILTSKYANTANNPVICRNSKCKRFRFIR